MPYQINWESPTKIVCQFFGKVDFDELNMATNAFYNDHRSDYVKEAFWDFTEMTSFEVDASEASEMAHTDNAASNYIKRLYAAFITQDEGFAELIRHYIEEMERIGSPWNNRLFQTMDQAKKWIDEAKLSASITGKIH
jgi:hypothetical protein